MHTKLRAITWITLAIFGLAILFTATAGKGSRGLFDPFQLQAQRQTEWLIPFANVPVYRSAPTPQSYKLVDYLVAKGYWKSDIESKPRPLLMYRWNNQWRDGQSAIYAALGMRGICGFNFPRRIQKLLRHYGHGCSTH